MDRKLRPVERMRTSADFRRVFSRGRYFSTPALRIHYLRTSRECSRLGLVVSRRRGKANVRNRIKRLLRVVFRCMKGSLPGSFDVVLIPRGSDRELSPYRASFETFAGYVGRERRSDEKPGRKPGKNPARKGRSGKPAAKSPAETAKTTKRTKRKKRKRTSSTPSSR